MGAQRHTEGCDRQPSCRRRGDLGRSVGTPAAPLLWPGTLASGATDARGARRPAKGRDREVVADHQGSTPSSHGPWVAAFVQRLRELGWIEGRTIAIEHRWAEGRSDRAAEIAAEFVRRNVDVIVTSGTAVIVAAMQATSVIPIVFAAAGDPVGTGLVA